LNPLTIVLPEIVILDGYRWYTAGDATGRDAVAWTVSASLDGVVWTTVDTRDLTGNLSAITENRNTLAGTWTLAEGDTAMDVFSDVSPATIAAPGTLAILAGVSETLGPLAGDGAIRLDRGTLGINTFVDAAFTGGISGTGTVVKTGAAVQSLSGALAFRGVLVVDAGTLDLTGAVLTGVTNIVVRNGARLTGSATVNGNLTVTFETGGRYSASLAVSGTLTIEGDLSLVVPDGAAYPYSATLFTFASADAAAQNALHNALMLTEVPRGFASVVRVTGSAAVLTVAPSGTVLMVK
ncbi:MAG: hypothetical protein LBW77_01240, partial [Verrucomicrobiota bacterium]|nr:hypothetical protein [Verrucomicrobiota bacterium]